MDEEEFFHSLGLQTAASERASSTNNTSKQMSTPPQSHVFDGGGGEGGGVGDAPAAYDSIWTNVSGGVTNSNSEMSFIDAIGLYWLNPATDKIDKEDKGEDVNEPPTEAKPGCSNSTEAFSNLNESASYSNFGGLSGLQTFGQSQPSHQTMALNENRESLENPTADVEPRETVDSSVDRLSSLDSQNTELEDEMDFLSMLGLTKVEPPGRRWRLWHPEDEAEVSLGSETLLGTSYVDTDPTLMEDMGKRVLEEKENDHNHQHQLKQQQQQQQQQRDSVAAVKTKAKQSFPCLDCNKEFVSQVMLSRHLDSELHLKHCQSSSSILEPGKSRLKRKPSRFLPIQDEPKRKVQKQETKTSHEAKDDTNAKEEIRARGLVGCESCGARVQAHQFPKHLISHYHYHRSIGHPSSERLVLDNVAGIVRESPFRCQPCQFYCNWHKDLVNHVAKDPGHSQRLRQQEHELHQSQHQKQQHQPQEHQQSEVFWCTVCMRVIQSQEALCQHLRTEDHLELVSVLNRSIPTVIRAVQLVPCTLCNKLFRLNISLKKHMQTVHSLADFQLKSHEKFKCDYCEYWSYKETSVHTHKFLVHPKKDLKYKCNLCRKEFKKEVHIKQHRNSLEHKEAAERFKNPPELIKRQCTLCVEEFASVEELKTHLEAAHLKLLPQCTLCGNLFHFAQQLKGHVRRKCKSILGIPAPAGAHKCDFCGFSSDSEARLLRHIKFRHKEVKVDYKVWRCDQCSRPFVCRELLELHSKKFHKERKLYSCTVPSCNYNSFKRKLFDNHMRRTHPSTQQMFPCEECGKLYASMASLKHHNATVHAAAVSKARCLNCDFHGCDFIASFQSDLDRHKLKHSTDKGIKCLSCEFTCKRKSEMTRHFRLKHADILPQKCTVCDYQTKNSSHMKRHMKNHSGTETTTAKILATAPTRGDSVTNTDIIDPNKIIVIPKDVFVEQIIVVEH